MRRLLMPAIVTSLLLSGCSSPLPAESNSNEDTQVQDGANGSPGDESTLTQYFDAFTSGTPAGLERASELAVPGSVAEAFTIHQANLASADISNGFSVESAEYSLDGEDVEVLYDSGERTVFSDIITSSGRLEGYSINGIDIRDRVALGGGEAVEHKSIAGFEVISAYQATSNDSLQVVVQFNASERDISFSYISTYRNADGMQVDEADSYKPSLVVKDSSQLGYAVFPNSELGGDVLLKFATDDEGPLEVETLRVPVPSGVDDGF